MCPAAIPELFAQTQGSDYWQLIHGWDKFKIITTNRRYHQRLCLEAWHTNSAHAPLIMMTAAYFLTPVYTSSGKKRSLLVSV